MKKLITVSAMALLAVSAFGQGQVQFNNLDKANNILYLIRDASGTTLSGTAASAALLGGPAAGAVAYGISPVVTGNLTMLASPVTGNSVLHFRTGNAAGYVDTAGDAPRILNNVGYGASAALQMVVWTGSSPDWTSAWTAWQANPGTTQIAVSPMWTVTTTLSAIDTGFAVNTGLANLPGTSLTPVPEPSTMALAGLAGAALLIFRRRK